MDGETAGQKTNAVEDGWLEHIVRSRTGEALSCIEQVGHNENRKDGRFGDDEESHSDFAAIGESPGALRGSKRSCKCDHDCSLLLIADVRVFRMLAIPQWPPAAYGWNRSKVVRRWRRTHRPFESPSVPGIVPRFEAREIRKSEVHHEHQYADALYDCAECCNQIPDFPAATGLVGVNTARHAEHPGYMHCVKRQMKPDHKQPEMKFSESFAQHSAGDFGKPIVKRAKNAEQNSAHDHVVKERNHEVRVAKLPIERGDGHHHARKTGDEKLEKESNAEKHRCLE